MVWLEFGLGTLTGLILGVFSSFYLLFKTGAISGLISGEIMGLLEELPDILGKNPDLLKNITKPLIAAATSELGIEKDRGAGYLKIGGFKIPAELLQGLMGMMQAKGKQVVEEGVVKLLG